MKFYCSKTKAQRILKDCCRQGILFRSPKRPQRYYPSVLKADILEKLKEKGTVPIDRRSPPLTRPFQTLLLINGHKIFLTYSIYLVVLLFTYTSYNYSFLLNQHITRIFKRTVQNITKQSSMKRKLVHQSSSI